jgi:NADH:ubiquinone oxidoreductase subunit 5 (subunit L)/multisubunit Na+/H+ antiporter MnhA subunit
MEERDMRRFMTTMCVVGLLGAGAGVALAATPATNKFFSGSGDNLWNQNGSWARHGSANFTLATSGRYYTGLRKFNVYIKRFQGRYSTSCNGSHPVRATWIKVAPSGKFNFSFISSGAHVRIWGQFTSSNKANVQFLVNFSGSNTNPSGLNASCATWVRGSASF